MKKLLVIFISTFTNLIFGQVNLSQGLTACYALNGNANDPINNLTGTLSAVTPTVDRFGNVNSAVCFNGTAGSFIALPNSPILKTDQVSFSCWVKFDAVTYTQSIVFSSNGCSNYAYFGTYNLCIKNFNTGPRFEISKSSAIGANCTPPYVGLIVHPVNPPVVQTWYHLGFCADKDSLKFYFNGNLYTATTMSIPWVYDSAANIYLGGTNLTASQPFIGSLDDVKFYDRLLTDSEMNQLYTEDFECIKDVTSLTEDKLDSHFTMYPNPTHGKCFIDISNEKIKEYEVIDLFGSLILKGKVNSDINMIDLGNYPNGIYFLKIKNEEIFKTIKIVKE